MTAKHQIRGAGGGGGKDGGGSGRTPVESPDSLRSRQYARVVDLVSEGEIVGLVNGLKSVYLNDTPVQNPDGSFNFSGVTMASRVGTQSQDYIPGFASVEAETAVSVPVENAAPVVRSISNANANAVRVTVSVPQLSQSNTANGDLGGTSVSIAIDVQTAGGGYVEKISDTISGKTTSRYQRAYRIELTGTGPWDVRVRRLTADSTSSALNNATYWDSYTEIVDAKLRYPNSALVAMSVDSERFNAIPSRGYEIKGLLVRIPGNYNPETRAYTGTWDGTFTTAWTDNPAWCFYDLVTNARYGLGAFIDAGQVDKWSLYEIAQHCDELVPDGYGGMEPRFTCSLYLQSQQEAFKVINDMAAIFCGMAFWGAGSIIPVQDAPSDPVKLFTHANVVPSAEGMYFNYAGSSVKTRHTVALVSWNDPADRYRQKIEYVEDLEGIAQYGIVQTEVVALGCTSRGQAHRYGRRILYTERMETETISFRAGLDGLDLAPGDIFQTTDPVRAGVRLGGRLLAATTDTLTLDAAVTLDGAATYTLWAVLPNGAVESRAVVTGAGTTFVLAVSPDFSDAPQAMAMWVLAASNLAPETWRAISISEADGGMIAEVAALKYSPNKYLEIEQGIVLEALPTSSLTTTQGAPAGFIISEDLYLITPSVVGARITASWQGNAARHELQYRIRGGNWITLSTSATSLDIQPVEAGTYEFTLTAISTLGVRSIPVTATKEIYGKTAAPAQVGNFVVTKVGGVAIAVWALVADLDVRVGGRIVVRHSPMVSGATWQDGVVLEEFTGDSVTGLLPLITGTYMVKAKDSSGIYSLTSSSFIATEGMVTGFNTVATSTQAPGFTGTKTNTAVVGGVLRLDTALMFDDAPGLFDLAAGLFDSSGGVSPTGSYQFDTYTDLGTVATRRVEVDLSVLSYDSESLFDYRAGLFDENTGDFDGIAINDCDATLYYAATNDNPSGSPTWSEWTPFFVADVTARALKFRMDLVSGDASHNIDVSTLRVDIKEPV
ncbi:host specificity protein J [Rhodoferax sp. TH121]|uniref:host specificity protein J n=1 Tax=Rhodoferax sp. TH121 TaxID=2022803 RepID=UPI0015963BFA|nr:phage tail protein [Rhodoferax sp. TH121]